MKELKLMFGKFGLNQKLIKSKQMIKSLLFFLRDLHGDPWGKQGDLCHIREIPGYAGRHDINI